MHGLGYYIVANTVVLWYLKVVKKHQLPIRCYVYYGFQVWKLTTQTWTKCAQIWKSLYGCEHIVFKFGNYMWL